MMTRSTRPPRRAGSGQADSSGTVIGQQGHYPFGEAWYAQNTTTNWMFTTYQRDLESGNDYAMARYDVNRLGRFASPDPLGGSPSDPQSVNRYAYVRDDPVNRVDPLGLRDNDACALTHDCLGGAGLESDEGCGGPFSLGCDGGGYGGGGGGAAIDLCGVDPFCIASGGVNLLDLPEAQVHCDSDGYCMVGSEVFAQYNVGGTYTVDWGAQRQAEIQGAIDAINKAFRLIATNQGRDPDEEVSVRVQYSAGVWNVTLWNCTPNCTVSETNASATGWPDPVTFMHGGDASWYFGSLFGFNVGHLIAGDPASAHVDPFGPLNPLHYLIQMPAMLDSAAPAGYTTCSINGGCN